MFCTRGSLSSISLMYFFVNQSGVHHLGTQTYLVPLAAGTFSVLNRNRSIIPSLPLAQCAPSNCRGTSYRPSLQLPALRTHRQLGTPVQESVPTWRGCSHASPS